MYIKVRLLIGGSANHYDLFCCLRRDTVMNVLRVVDPHGVEMRRRRRINRRVYSSLGPNHVWYVDGCVLQTYKIYLSVHGYKIYSLHQNMNTCNISFKLRQAETIRILNSWLNDGYVIIYFAGGGADRI